MFVRRPSGAEQPAGVGAGEHVSEEEMVTAGNYELGWGAARLCTPQRGWVAAGRKKGVAAVWSGGQTGVGCGSAGVGEGGDWLGQPCRVGVVPRAAPCHRRR